MTTMAEATTKDSNTGGANHVISSNNTSITDLSKPPILDPEKNEKTTLEQPDSPQSQDEATQDAADLSRMDTSDFPTTFPLIMIVIALVLSMFLVALDLTIVATAIPRITDQFHSLSQVGWYGSAFFLTIAAFQSTWGKAYKYFPMKIAFLISIFIFELGSLICGVAPNSTALIVGRAIAGAGGAGISSGCYTIIAYSVKPNLRPAFTGVLGATFSVASVIGPLLGGVFTDGPGWRWCFYVNLPIGGVAAAAILFFFHTPRTAKPQPATLKEKILQMDIPGTLTIVAAATCYLLAMQWGGSTKPWSSSDVIGLLVGFGLLVILFIVIEYVSGDYALIQGRLLKDRTIMAMAAYIFFIAGAFFGLLYYLPIYFQATRGVSAEKSGIDNLPLVLGAGLFTIVSGVLITIFGLYVPIMLFGSMLAAIGGGLVYTLDVNSPSSKWIGYQSMMGIGLGLTFQVPVIVCQAVVKPIDLSTVSAMILFFQTIGGAIFISAAQAGFTNKLIEELPKLAPSVNKALIIVTGATELRSTFTSEQLPGILAAYMQGLRVPFAIALSCACVSFVLALAPRWENIKGKIPMGGGA